MSSLIEPCAGFVHFFPQGNGQSGFLKLSPPLPRYAIIQATPIDLREIVQPSVTLNDKRTIYVFGSAWAEGSVSGMLLLGKDGTGGSSAGELKGWYESNRIKKGASPVTISIADASYSGYVIGMSFGDSVPQFNKQGFSISFLISLD
jgi:hypothetical protein